MENKLKTALHCTSLPLFLLSLLPFLPLFLHLFTYSFPCIPLFVCDLVLKPISAITKVKLNVKPGSDLSMPKVSSYNKTFAVHFYKINAMLNDV